MHRPAQAPSCTQGSCEGCPSAAAAGDCRPEEGLGGSSLVAASLLAFVLPVGLAVVLALWAGPEPLRAAGGGVLGLVLGAVAGRPILRRLENARPRP